MSVEAFRMRVTYPKSDKTRSRRRTAEVLSVMDNTFSFVIPCSFVSVVSFGSVVSFRFIVSFGFVVSFVSSSCVSKARILLGASSVKSSNEN